MINPRRSRVISAKTPLPPASEKDHSMGRRDPDQQETLPGYYADDGSFITLPARPPTTRQTKSRQV